MPELLVDFITSLDGYASGEGWPGFWGLEGVGQRGMDGGRASRARARRVRAAPGADVARPPVPPVPRPRGSRPVAGDRRQPPVGRGQRFVPQRARRLCRRRARLHPVHGDDSDSAPAAGGRRGGRRSTSSRSTSRPWPRPPAGPLRPHSGTRVTAAQRWRAATVRRVRGRRVRSRRRRARRFRRTALSWASVRRPATRLCPVR